MPQTFHIAGPAFWDANFGSDDAAIDWSDRITSQIVAMQDYRKFMEENQVQMGHKPGVNSGHGYIEALIPSRLWYMLEKRDPEFFTDPRKWEKFINAHPELKVNLPLTSTRFNFS